MYFLLAFLASAVLERPDLAAVFAEQGTPGMASADDTPKRIAIGRALLARLGVRPP